MHARVFAAATLALAGVLSINCGGIVDPSNNTTDTFTGTIAVGGSGLGHPFTGSKTGEISVKVTALSPSSSQIFVGVVWTGTASDGSCTGQLGQIWGQSNFAQVGLPAISNRFLSGKYCLLLYDVGSFTTTETYTVTVSHP